MKNCAVAECGSEVRAMAIVPRLLFKRLLASFWIGAFVAFSRIPLSIPPPWIINPSITRWKIVLL